MKNKLLFILVLVLCSIGMARFSHRETSGFRMSKIRNNFPAQTTDSLLPSNGVQKILKGNFTYLGRGLQSFAFLSPDGQYVLKIFNNGPKRTAKRLKLLPFSWAKERSRELNEKYEKWFGSVIIAHQELKEETGLVYVHLNPTDNCLNIVHLVDKLQIAHEIDLDKIAFVLQKKATLVYPALLEMKGMKKHEEAKRAIVSLLNLIENRFAKGISDSDPLIRTNFGFIGETAMQIDVGPFDRNSKVREESYFQPEIGRITQSLKEWVYHHYPEIYPSIEQEIESRKIQSAPRST